MSIFGRDNGGTGAASALATADEATRGTKDAEDTVQAGTVSRMVERLLDWAESLTPE